MKDAAATEETRDPESLRGSCLCGRVRFEVTAPFPKLYQCHCSLCRKQGGEPRIYRVPDEPYAPID